MLMAVADGTRFLLDTHTFLWWHWNAPELGPLARSVIQRPGNAIFVSAVSNYEMAYERNRGRLEAPENLTDYLIRAGFLPLPLSLRHAEEAGRLPLSHRDPFDRMLAAQAMVEGLILITNDSAMRGFGVSILPARR